jgi:2-C-methyl-D-erythritol 4-phosphate cytidylyltransferase
MTDPAGTPALEAGPLETVAAIVPAAGRGERLGPGAPKALRRLGGVPMLVHAVRNLAAARLVSLVIVAAPPDQVQEVRALLADHHTGAPLHVVAGGPTRQESVRAALAALPDDVGIVLVHDAARPLAPVELVDAVARAVRAGAAAVVPVLPVTDTVKRVQGDVVVETVDRSQLRAVQTPQGFRRAVLEEAHLDPGAVDATDDAGLVERAGHRVVVIPGAEEAFKVTRPLDLVLAEAVWSRIRPGHGR